MPDDSHKDWSIDRIDFVDNVSCHFCNRALKTNIAYILTNQDDEIPSGPTCAKKNSKNPDDKIPDFTKASLDVVEEDDDEGKGGGGKTGGGGTKKAKPHGFAELEYLRLRAEKLVGFKGAMYPRLDVIYEKYKRVGLKDDDIKQLANLISYTAREKPLFAPKNLQNCYAYAFWLKRFLEKKGANEFVESVLFQLRKNLHLSEPQLIGINNWFKHIERMPILDTKAFAFETDLATTQKDSK